MATSSPAANNTPLSTREQAEFRSLVPRVAQERQMSMTSIAEALGFHDASPLYKLLRRKERVTTHARLNALRALLRGTAAMTKTSPAKAATKPATKPAAKSAPAAGSAGDAGLVSPELVRRFADTVNTLHTKHHLTVESIASKIGYQHTSSLYKALRRKRVTKKIYDSLMTLAAQTGQGATAAKPAAAKSAPTKPAAKPAAKPAPKPAAKVAAKPAAKPAAKVAAKATSTPRATTTAAPVVGGRLQAAAQHLGRAKAELERASSGNLILAPGLKDVIARIEEITQSLQLA